MKLTVACVEWGNYLGRGAEYVQKLRAMVARHLAQPHRFVCLTDNPARHLAPGVYYDMPQRLAPHHESGCWEKLHLFRPGRFNGRVLYLDLDSVIVGPLDELVQHKGAVDLTDWGWDRHVVAGGHLVWDGDEHEDLYTRFTSAIADEYSNDQEWMTALGGWDRLPPEICRSYRYHSKDGPPENAAVIAFHGKPKPHEFSEGWVWEAWR